MTATTPATPAITPAMTDRTPRPASGIPAHGTRPDFAPGNVQSMQSGARSPRVYGQLAQQLAAGLLEDRPDLARYPEAVASWATIESQAALFRRHLAEVGPLDSTATPRASLLDWLTRLERLALQQRAVLGLDPSAEARLARDRAAAASLAIDVDGLAARGRAALAAREARGLSPLNADLAGQVLTQVRASVAEPTTTTIIEPEEAHNDNA